MGDGTPSHHLLPPRVHSGRVLAGRNPGKLTQDEGDLTTRLNTLHHYQLLLVILAIICTTFINDVMVEDFRMWMFTERRVQILFKPLIPFV